MTKRLMNVSIAILCLALAYHLGYRNAGAQAGGSVAGVAGQNGLWLVMVDNGDTYVGDANDHPNWRRGPNIFAGPTPVEGASLGQVKVRYR